MTIDSNWVSVMTPNYIYVGIAKREDFDRIGLPVGSTGSADKPVLCKTAQDANGCTVVFQHWYGPTPAERAAAQAVELLRARRKVPA